MPARLPDSVQAALAAEKDLPEVDAELRARLAARLARTIDGDAGRASRKGVKAAAAAAIAAASTTQKSASAASAAGAASTSLTGGGAVATGASLLAPGKVAIGLLIFSLGSGVGAAVHAIRTPAPQEAVSASVSSPAQIAPSAPLTGRSPLGSAREASASDPAPSATSSATDVPIEESPPRASAQAIASPNATSKASASASARAGDDPLRRERALLDTARMAVLRGDKAAALSALQAHAREFPNGQHQSDRAALERRALALPDGPAQ